MSKLKHARNTRSGGDIIIVRKRAMPVALPVYVDPTILHSVCNALDHLFVYSLNLSGFCFSLIIVSVLDCCVVVMPLLERIKRFRDNKLHCQQQHRDNYSSTMASMNDASPSGTPPANPSPAGLTRVVPVSKSNSANTTHNSDDTANSSSSSKNSNTRPGAMYVPERARGETPLWGRHHQPQQDLQHAVLIPPRGLRGMIQQRRQQRRQRNCLEAHVSHAVNGTGGDVVNGEASQTTITGTASSTRTTATNTPRTGRTRRSPLIDDDDDEELLLEDSSESMPTAAASSMSMDHSNNSSSSSGTFGTLSRQHHPQQRRRSSLIDEDDEDEFAPVVPDVAAMYSSMSELLHSRHDWNAAFLSSKERRLIDDVMEIFPNANSKRVADLLRQSSYTATLIVLAEESNNPAEMNKPTVHPKRDEIMSRILEVYPNSDPATIDQIIMKISREEGIVRTPSSLWRRQVSSSSSSSNAVPGGAHHNARATATDISAAASSTHHATPSSYYGRQLSSSMSAFLEQGAGVGVGVIAPPPPSSLSAYAYAPDLLFRRQSSGRGYHVKSKQGRVEQRRLAEELDFCCSDSEVPSDRPMCIGLPTSLSFDNLEQLLDEEEEERQLLESMELSKIIQ
jgi:hypothetical protein